MHLSSDLTYQNSVCEEQVDCKSGVYFSRRVFKFSMSPALETDSFDKPLDVFGQNARLNRLYTQLCFCFTLHPDTAQARSQLSDHLHCALKAFNRVFPWTAGQVVHERGAYRVVPWSQPPGLVIEDAQGSMPSMQRLRDAGFPFSMLNERDIAPCRTIPECYDEPAPAFLAKVTHVVGGVLIVFNAQHNCMDMVSQSLLVSLFAKACRGLPFTAEDMYGDATWDSFYTRTNPVPPPISQPVEHTTRSSEASQWAYFYFASTALAQLKTQAMSTIEKGFVSTDDALSAFVWQAVTRARIARLSSADWSSTFERQVDARSYLGLSPTYIGNMVWKTTSRLPAEQVGHGKLGTVATELRSRLGPQSNIAQNMLAAAQALDQSFATSNTTRAGRGGLPPTDLKMSSWAKEKCYDLDFGKLLGKPEAIRRPAFQAWEGLAYLLPKDLEGGIAVALCLRRVDLDRLKADPEFSTHCRHVG